MSERYTSILLNYRWLVLALWSVLLLASATIYVGRFHIDNSVGIWFRENDPDIERFRDFNRAFGGTEWIFAVVQTQSIHDRSFKTQLHRTVAQLEALPQVQRVLSVVSPGRIAGTGGGGRAADPYRLPYTNLNATAGKALEIAMFRDLLVQPGDNRHLGVLIRTSRQPLSDQMDWTNTVDAINRILRSKMGIDDYWLAGTPVINAELNRAARRDMFVFYCVLSLLFILFGRLFLGQTRDLAVLLAVVLGAVLPPLGLVGSLGLSFNLVTIMLPTILVAMSASAAIHMINAFHAARGTMPSEKAAEHAVSALIRPVFWTTATTVASFLTLLQSDVAPIRQVGYLAAVGLSLGFAGIFTSAPLILEILWRQRAAGRDTGSRLWISRSIAGLAGLARHSRAVTACAFLLFAACLAGLPNLRADTDYVNFFRAGRQINADYRAIRDAGFSQYSLELDLLLPDNRTVRDPDFSGALGRLGQAIAGLEGVHKALTVGQLPAVAAVWPVTAGNAPGALAQGLVTPDGRRTRIVIFSDHMSSQTLDEFRKTVAGLVRSHLPAGVDARLLGTNVLWANMDMSVIKTQVASLTIIFCLLLVLLPILTGSVRTGLIGLLVSVLPVLSVLGLMGWAGLTINVATCLIGGVALGVAIDDTIFLLLQVRRQIDGGTPLQQAIPNGLRRTGKAMVTTSLIMTICFLTMGLSDFMPTAQFGRMFALTIIAALTADLMLLPALLFLFGRR